MYAPSSHIHLCASLAFARLHLPRISRTPQVLGVAHDADAQSIRHAYHRKSLQLHPDKNPGDASAEQVIRASAAAAAPPSSPLSAFPRRVLFRAAA